MMMPVIVRVIGPITEPPHLVMQRRQFAKNVETCFVKASAGLGVSHCGIGPTTDLHDDRDVRP